MTYEHDGMVASILVTWDRATGDQREAGTGWYAEAARVTRAISAETGIDQARVTYTLAALSPRNPWNWNVADTYCYAVASRDGLDRPTATTFERNRRRAWDAISGDGEWLGVAPKVRAFVAAILGDHDAVVVDVWAYRVATGDAPPRSGSFAAKLYQPIAEAYRDAARARGVSPCVMQAVTWLVARDGAPQSRHAVTIKRGTPEFVRGLLS